MSERHNLLERAWTELETIVGSEHMRHASMDDVIDETLPVGVIAPGTAQEIARVLQYCSSAGVSVVPRGGGTKLGLGNPPQKADFILSTARLDRVVEHVWGDMTTTVEAGCTIDRLQQALAEHGQRLALDPVRPEAATVGGVLATAESGTLRIRYGAVRDLVLGVELALADGSVIKAGGKVVKNVAGYDLTRLVIGSLGTLGVITRAVFRLHPIPVATATYSTVLTSLAEANKLALAILDSQLVYTGLQLRAERPDQIALEVRFEGIPESLQDQFARLNRLVAGRTFLECSCGVWTARQQLFADAAKSVVCKFGVLPSQIGSLCEAIFQYASGPDVAAFVVAQGTGLAEVRFEAARVPLFMGVLNGLRREVERLDGTMVVRHCPALLKEALDVWGTPKYALSLMQEIKGKFDPARTLNPGRFVGAI
ncbi:MAG TPA: FAD-binding oxidoreductase [Candidatus Binatia bacterium]|nr:FAD-binding oxidoreductase [Candidatus Binatia bacterium]